MAVDGHRRHADAAPGACSRPGSPTGSPVPSPSRRYAPYVAGAFAGLALLGIDDYWHQIVIANSDQIDVTLCLAAIDCHLCRRPRLAFGALVLASLGRPEAWPFAALYAIWLCRAVPGTRILAVVGIASIPLLWFGISALTAKGWLRAGDLALNSANVIHGNKFTGRCRPPDRPVHAADANRGRTGADPGRHPAGPHLADARGRRRCCGCVVEIAFALHGWSAVPRYLFEPAAVLITLAGAGGRPGAGVRARRRPPALRWAGPAAVAILLIALIPTIGHRIGALHDQIGKRRVAQLQLHRLQGVIDRLGGPGRDPRLRTAGHARRLAEHGGLGDRPQRGQRRLQAGPRDRPGRSDRRAQAAPGRMAGATGPHRPAKRTACASLHTDTEFSPS